MVMAKKETGYEELRRQRLEENKRRMEELHIPRLSLALKSSSPKPSLKPSPMKRVKRTEMVEVRRSGRVANLPAPDFKDIVSYGRFDIPISSNSNAKMVMAKKETGYEELRQQRLEENKRRMEELHIPRLSLALKSSSPKPSLKPSPMKQVKRTEMVAVRRSGRVANLPAPDYKEIVSYGRFDIPIRELCQLSTRDLVYASDKARASATLKAEELELSLGADYPTFVRPMLQSHVTGGFRLGLPVYWCRRHLPKYDDTVTLIDEEGEEYPTVYSRKSGESLSRGWRRFSIAHGLVDGDALVFQLIRPTAFKVYIIRVNSFEKGSNL